MKVKFLAILFILVFGAVSILAGFGFGLIGDGAHTTCPISRVSGENCPMPYDSLALAAHHISGLRQFSQAVAGMDLVVWAFFAVALTFAAQIFLGLVQKFFEAGAVLQNKKRVGEARRFFWRKKFIYSLVIHNERGPRMLPWAYNSS